MSRRVPSPALTDAVASFQAEIARLAMSAAGVIIRAELARREAIPLVRPRGRPKGWRAPKPAQAAQVEMAVMQSQPAEVPPAAEATTTTTPTGKRTQWTREAIIELLANAIVSGAPTDAAFMTRHGPKGAVAATRRLFGRFEAGLNVAALHVSKLYPEGPPQKRSAGR